MDSSPSASWCRGEDPDEDLQPCPFCEVEGSEWELTCSSCSKQLPFCIASGSLQAQLAFKHQQYA